MEMQLAGRIGSGDEQLDGDLRDIDIVSHGGGLFLYAATGQTGGISVYHVQNDGALASLADSSHYSLWGMGVGSFDAVDLDGQQQLILSGLGDGKLIRYRLEEDGTLARTGKIDLPGDTTQTHAALTAAALEDGRTALYTIDDATGALTGWLSSGTGGLSGAVGFSDHPAAFAVDGPVMLSTIDGFLLAADTSTQGLRSYRIDAETGALTLTGSLGPADGLGLALPTAIETVTAHGATWAILGGADSNSLSVMQISPTGGLILADHVLDTRATRFAGVSALDVVRAEDHVFVVAGGADDGISLFALLPDGRLVHLQTLIHDSGLGLEDITGIAATRAGDNIQIFVSSGGDAGLSQFTLPLADLGAVLQGSPGADANTPLSGTARNDLMLAQDGQNILLGRGGDDILVSDVGGGILTGGGGADIFVLCPTTDPLQITDFRPGADQLDLSAFAMLRSPDQLGLTATATGVTVTYGTTVIDIHSHAGGPLSAQDLWPGGFTTPDRILIPQLPQPALIRGTPGQDLLSGGAGDDRIRARAGDDTLSGHGGDDRLHGGGGRDLLRGGSGRDDLTGAGGGDILKGGRGRDDLTGKGGKDRLKGGGGSDELTGARGNDRLTGGGGDDLFIFAAGHGADRIRDFAPGADRIRFKIDGLDFAGLTIRAQGSDTLIETGAGTILLTGLTPGDLSFDDFLFF